MLLNTKTKDIEKFELYTKQKGVCLLCNRPLNENINANHLDHDHELHGPTAGRVRGLLCNLCNSLEGQVKHKFGRSGLVSKDVDMVEWLQNLMKYYSQDTTSNKIHPQFVPDRVKWFNRLSREDMIIELNRQGIKFDLSLTKAKLVSLYRKEFRKLVKEGTCKM